MVATLIVALPSVHEGGELIIRHEGRVHEIVFSGAASGLELSYAAFYADCQHEVKPLSSGYRLCLAYNVTLTTSPGRQGLRAPAYGTVGARVAQLLGAWREKGETGKLAITLEHRYTRDGLTLNKLKGVGRARAEVLFEAAEQKGPAQRSKGINAIFPGLPESSNAWVDARNQGDPIPQTRPCRRSHFIKPSEAGSARR